MTHVSEGRQASLLFWSTRAAIAVVGIVLSVVLHELYHIALHWGDIVAIRVFPAPFVVAEVEFIARAGHSMLVEEVIAYVMSTLVIIATIFTLLALPHKKGTAPTVASLLLTTFRNAAERVGA